MTGIPTVAESRTSIRTGRSMAGVFWGGNQYKPEWLWNIMQKQLHMPDLIPQFFGPDLSSEDLQTEANQRADRDLRRSIGDQTTFGKDK